MARSTPKRLAYADEFIGPREPHSIVCVHEFPGFCNSFLDDAVDREIEQQAEYMANDRDDELAQPTHLRLSVSEYCDLLVKHVRHSDVFDSLACAWIDALNYDAHDVLDFDLGLKYESMSSPREYNFATDRVFAHIPTRIVRRLLAMAQADSATLCKVIGQRHSNRSGFVSFYNNQCSAWFAKPIEDWDHNELGTLLSAALGGIDDDTRDLFDAVEMRTIEDGAYQEVDANTDWIALDADVDALRAEKAEAWAEANPDHVQPEPRCPDTPDLFA